MVVVYQMDDMATTLEKEDDTTSIRPALEKKKHLTI